MHRPQGNNQAKITVRSHIPIVLLLSATITLIFSSTESHEPTLKDNLEKMQIGATSGKLPHSYNRLCIG